MIKTKKLKRILCLLNLSLFILYFFIPPVFIFEETAMASEGEVNIGLSAGDRFTIALKSDGTVWAWGDNSYGQLGDGTNTNRNEPEQVPGLNNVIAISAGSSHSTALKNDGTVWAWGKNNSGQLGDGTWINKNEPVQVINLTDVKEISSGCCHSMTLKNDGTVWAWGDNYYGQLGNGGYIDRNQPVQASGLTDVKEISAGGFHSMALKNDGMVWAWGENYHGQLGIGNVGDNLPRITPVEVSVLTDVTAISAGGNHSLAIKNNDTVWAWGYGQYGQLGNGTTSSDEIEPLQITGLTDVLKIIAGWNHSLAIKSDGTVLSWGMNFCGQLGDGTTTHKLQPVQITDFTNVTGIFANECHTVAFMSDGSVWSWGRNLSGELGDGTFNNRNVPGQSLINLITEAPPPEQTPAPVVTTESQTVYSSSIIIEGTAVPVSTIRITGGSETTTGLADSEGNFSIQVFLSLYDVNNLNITAQAEGKAMSDSITVYITHEPSELPDAMPESKLSAGHDHSLFLKGDGKVWSWGGNNSGQLGSGNLENSAEPVEVLGLTDVRAVSAGSDHSLALKSDGTVWAWGDNFNGQLGDGTLVNRNEPVQVSGLSDVIAVSGGAWHSLALKSDGTVWAWGDNFNGQLGDGSWENRNEPVQVSGFTDVIAVSAGGWHSLALKSDGTVWAWGYNELCMLGDGTWVDRNEPVKVSLLTDVSAISAGGLHSLALKRNGTVWTWGYQGGEESSGSDIEVVTPMSVCPPNVHVEPVRVTGLDYISGISAGGFHSIALRGDGSVWSWGNNFVGQLGDGSLEEERVEPAQLLGLSDILTVSSGSLRNHNFAVKINGMVWAWGSNEFSQLGDGTLEDRNEPVLIFNVEEAQTATPVITTVAQTVSAGTICIEGTSNQDSAITITGGAFVATGTAGVDGNFSVKVVLNPDVVNTLSITAEIEGKTISESITLEITQIIIYGDLSGNGDVSVSDVIIVARGIVGLDVLNPSQIISADVNGDGKVSVADAILIARKIVSLIIAFPVEES